MPAGNDATINAPPAVSISTTETAGTLQVNNGSGTASQMNVLPGADLTMGGWSRVANAGTFTVTQTGGIVRFNGGIGMADGSGTSTWTISDGTLQIANSGYATTVGMRGTGVINLSGTGVVNSLGTTYLGAAAGGTGGTGVVNQSGGTFNASGNIALAGNGGAGTYNLTGGTLNLSGNVTDGSGAGAFNLDGGTLNWTGSTFAADTVRVGNAATAAFTLAAGKTMSAGTLFVGASAGSNGTFTLNGGTLNVGPNIAYIANSGAGTFTQNSGTSTFSGGMTLSDNGGAAVVNLLGGSMTVGNAGYGLTIGMRGGTSNVNVNGAGASLTSNGILYVGSAAVANGGSGVLTVTAGTVNANNTIALASQSGTSGTINLNGGTLNAAGNITDGSGTSTLNLNGGALNWTGSSMTVDNLRIADAASSAASLTVASGKTVTAGNLIIGNAAGASGSLTVQAGGSFTVTGDARPGNSGASTITQTGGTLTFGGNTFFADNGGSSAYNISGGTAAFSGGGMVSLGMRSPGPAVINLTGTGSLTSAKAFHIGSSSVGGASGGSGVFTQDGAATTATFNADLFLGNQAGTTGTYNLKAGTVTVNGVTRPGVSGTGVINQTGGSITFSQEVNMGDAAGGVGVYNLSAGTMALTATSMTVGMRGQASFNVSGTGSFTASAGVPLYVGSRAEVNMGVGYVNQTGGTVTANGGVVLANRSGTTGIYNLGGGTLSTTALTKGPGTGIFNFSGGKLDADSIGLSITQEGGSLIPGGVGAIGTTTVASPNSYTMVAGTPNWALASRGSVAWQSSTYSSSYPAVRAIDANLDTGTNFSHTLASDNLQQWEVDLKASSPIARINIYNRYTNGSRLVTDGGFRASILSGGAVVWTQDYVGAAYTHPFVIHLPAGVSGDLFRLNKIGSMPANDNRTFNLTEVQVVSPLLTPSLDLEIDAATGTSDRLVVGGALALDGTLNVANLGGTLAENMVFDLLDWGSITGTFDTVNLPSGIAWDTSRLYTTGEIQAVPEPLSALLLATTLPALALRARRRLARR